MRLPRNLSGVELAKTLRRFDYEVTRQTGSHMRLTRSIAGEHHITIPNHGTIKVGTLNGILRDVADHIGITKERLLQELFS